MRSTYLGVAVAALLPACSGVTSTSYVEPAIEVPARFMGGPSSALPDAANAEWWTDMSDPTLNSIVSTGLAQNLDISAAMARMDAARAAARGAGLPEQFSGGINASASRSRDDDGVIENDSGAGLSGGFVLDLFGQARSSGARAAAQADAAEFDVGAVRLAYLADVIGNYIDARFFQAAAAITRRSLATRRETLELIEGRAAVGEATELELAQAQSILANAEAVLPGLEAGFNASAIRIAALIGRTPDEVIGQLQRGAPQPRPRGNLAVGVPADLIRNRPDVRSAERAFAAAVAEVGISEANLYPSLSILGSIPCGGTGLPHDGARCGRRGRDGLHAAAAPPPGGRRGRTRGIRERRGPEPFARELRRGGSASSRCPRCRAQHARERTAACPRDARPGRRLVPAPSLAWQGLAGRRARRARRGRRLTAGRLRLFAGHVLGEAAPSTRRFFVSPTRARRVRARLFPIARK